MIRRATLLVAGSLLLAASAPARGQSPPRPALRQVPPPAADADVSFRVFARGQPIGSETVTVTERPDGWTVSTIGQLGAPVALTTNRAEASYDRDWRPRLLVLDGSVKNEAISVRTTFDGGRAVSQITQAGRTFAKTDAVAERTIVLPNLVFGLYEALAAQVSAVPPGTTFRVYVAPQAEVEVRLDRAVTERVSAPGRSFEARRHELSFQNPSGPLRMDLWTEGRRLMRLTIPSVPVDVIREDVASVATRLTTEYRANDEDVRIAANGFNLAGTVSRPAAPGAPGAPAVPAARLPAIVLVPGPDAADRDGAIDGAPAFAQLAAGLADAGHLVVRYDRRGTGQSGGRAESATLLDYAEDARAVVKFLRRRKDVDRDRIAIVGHGDGAAITLVAAQREKDIAAVVVIAAQGTTGAELTLERQRRALERAGTPEAERAAKIELQKKLQAAVLTGKGWEEIPPALRPQADTPWFRSFLEFDPARLVPRLRQPLLIVAGDEAPAPAHAGTLAALANGRKQAPAAGVVRLPAVVAEGRVSPDLIARISEWLKQALRYS